MAISSPEQPYGEVFDRGYQHYDGARLGRRHAVRALTIYSIKRGLGIKKRWTAKIMPIVLYGLAFIPAFIILGILAFVPLEDLGDLGYDTLYESLEFIILIFAALLAPEMLCGDRRESVLQLYLSRPITRLDYLSAKISAMSLLLMTIIVLPPLMLFVGLALVDPDTVGYLRDNLEAPFQIVAYGALVSAYYAALGLIVATFTTRKGIAAAILIGGVLLTTAFIAGLFNALEDQSWRDYLILFSPIWLLTGLRGSFFGVETDISAEVDLSGFVYVLAIVIVVAAAMWFLRRTYLRED